MKTGTQLAAAGLLLLSAEALAADGVLEINQTCATSTGCFPGDAGGFPVEITASGSYRLTSDLSVTDPSVDGIRLMNALAGRSTIDLNGFSIVGPVTCTGAGPSLSCTAGQTGHGINMDSVSVSGTHVRNGTVQGFLNGLNLSSAALVEGVSARWNLGVGIGVAASSIVRESIGRENFGKGIAGGDGTSIGGSTARGNFETGIFAGNGSEIGECTSMDNGGEGILGNHGSRISRCVARGNAGRGIFAGSGAHVEGCTSTANGGDGIGGDDGANISSNTVAANLGDGVDVGDHSSVRGNLIRVDAVSPAAALRFAGTASIYAGNTLYTTAGAAAKTGTAFNAGGNLCNGAACPP